MFSLFKHDRFYKKHFNMIPVILMLLLLLNAQFASYRRPTSYSIFDLFAMLDA